MKAVGLDGLPDRIGEGALLGLVQQRLVAGVGKHLLRGIDDELAGIHGISHCVCARSAQAKAPGDDAAENLPGTAAQGERR